MEELPQQGALLELHALFAASESQLDEHRSRIHKNLCTRNDLVTILNCCKVEINLIIDTEILMNNPEYFHQLWNLFSAFISLVY